MKFRLNFLRKMNQIIFPGHLQILKKETKDCKTILDVACGSNSALRYLKNQFTFSVGVDLFGPSLKKSKKAKIHNKYFKYDIRKLFELFPKNSFDCVYANDVLEHLTKEEGKKFLKDLDKIAKKKVIIFTPNGFVPQKAYDNNPWQEHKSGWTLKEMQSEGYQKIYGLNGWKKLKHFRNEIKYNPYIFFWFLSRLSEKFVLNRPKYAFHLFCIKKQKNFKIKK